VSYEQNKEIIKKKNNNYKKTHPKQEERRRKNYYQKHTDAIIEHNTQNYYNNKERVLQQQKIYETNRRKNDPNYRFARVLRSRLNNALRGDYKAGSAVKDLGCSMVEFRLYIESKFTPGMTWENYGLWEFDHIKPLSKFDLTNREEFLKACHYTNIQPLWRADNIKKGNK